MGASSVLAITEIVYTICGFLDDDKAALLSLACCNKVLSEAVLDVLWSKMDSIMPFVPFIPEGIRDACSVSKKYVLFLYQTRTDHPGLR